MIPSIAQGMVARALGVVLLACALCALGGFAGGVWVGIAWQKGWQAQQDNQVLKSDVEQLTKAALELRQRGVDIAQDFRTAHRRMEAITEDREQFDARNREHFTRQRDALDALLAAHPGIGDCDIGDAGMQHWNTSARGARAKLARAAKDAIQVQKISRQERQEIERIAQERLLKAQQAAIEKMATEGGYDAATLQAVSSRVTIYLPSNNR